MSALSWFGMILFCLVIGFVGSQIMISLGIHWIVNLLICGFIGALIGHYWPQLFAERE